jgi:23S rRNA pseudouridine1911/1915/1917 synthase
MSTEQLEFTAEQSSERLDKVIMAHVGDRLSRAQVQILIEDGMVLVNDRALKPGAKLKGGELIRLTITTRDEPEKVQPEDITLNVLYEDDDLAVIDKPAGMVVHPGDLNETGTLVSAALNRWPQIAAMNIEEKRAGIVHRLDKDTSGLILIAKHDRARRNLMEQFQNRSVEKIYTALLDKRPQTLTGRIEAPIGRDPKQRKRMAVLREGKPAITEFTILDDQFAGDYALVKVRLLTGRTHQIRVHMAFIDCPIVGDQVYGFRKQRVGLKRQFLHASEISFDHPTSGERMHFESPLPVGLQNLLDKLKQG